MPTPPKGTAKRAVLPKLAKHRLLKSTPVIAVSGLDKENVPAGKTVASSIQKLRKA